MSFNITLPKITATNPNEQMRQMQSYIYQLAEQLNWALGTLESSSGGNISPAIKMEDGSEVSEKDAESTFNSIKALIIKSADIVKAYEETIMKDFNGTYFADSDFGTYLLQTKASISANSQEITEKFARVETIEGKVDGIEDDVKTTNAYIKRGYLGPDKETGDAAYGIAVGETDENGVYKQYAWFTADKLTFFGENDDPVAFIGNGCLRIAGKSVFHGEVQLGGYKIDTSDGVAFTWIG
jgi:hypothetical protein